MGHLVTKNGRGKNEKGAFSCIQYCGHNEKGENIRKGNKAGTEAVETNWEEKKLDVMTRGKGTTLSNPSIKS